MASKLLFSVRTAAAVTYQNQRIAGCSLARNSKLQRKAIAARLLAAHPCSSRRPTDQQLSTKPTSTQEDPLQPSSLETAAQQPKTAERHGIGLSLASVAAVAAAITVAPLALPNSASASSLIAMLVPHSLQQHQSWQTVCWGCTAAGAASLLVTLVCTSRFLVSFYPSLEREAEQQRWRLPWVAITLFDPLLQPMRRRFFGQTEEGDLDYAAVALLASVCSLLECLVGKDGVMLPFIPDFGLRDALQYLIIFQHGWLLPIWVLVVLRWGRVL